jgi:class 3 adenylate cyclase
LNNRIDRKLCAILAADVYGYSRMMHEDEVRTIEALRASREITDGLIESYGGRIIFTAGDSVVAEFAAAGSCVLCARDIQLAIADRNSRVPAEQEMLFRIGANVGDVIIIGADLLGEGVNIAARLEALADPGGVYLSGSVYDQIVGDPSMEGQFAIEELGRRKLKNIEEEVRVYRLGGLEETLPSDAPVAGMTERPAAPAPVPTDGTTALRLDAPGGPVILQMGRRMAIGRGADPFVPGLAISHRQISRLGKQAELRWADGGFSLRDVGSANGTFLDDGLLADDQPATVQLNGGSCVIALGGGRNPPRKGICQLVVRAVEGVVPALRIELDGSVVDDEPEDQIARVWPGFAQELRLGWVFAPEAARIGSDLDCAVILPGSMNAGAKAEIAYDGDQFIVLSVGDAPVAVNDRPVETARPLADGDHIVLGQHRLAVGVIGDRGNRR